jgi:hypothetical protein
MDPAGRLWIRESSSLCRKRWLLPIILSPGQHALF